jgi:hypothetical protein
MANETMTLITSYTWPTSGIGFIQAFTNIPQTYTDLLITANVRTDASATSAILYLNFNGVPSDNRYSHRALEGNGSSVASYNSSGATDVAIARVNGDTATSNTFSNIQIYIPNYAGSTYKSVSSDYVTENNATAAFQGIEAALWSATNAITSMSLFTPGGGNYKAGSTFSLYGILKGSGGATVS